MSKAFEDHYSQLVGFRIIGFRYERDEHGDDEGWPVFDLRNPRTGEMVSMVLSRDPEGNGGGFAFIEDFGGDQ